MPLKQITNDGVSSTSSASVYDAETVRQTLARATEIEAQPQEAFREGSLNAAQIEALGRELGLSPAAVRQSLGELAGLPQHHQSPQHRYQTQDIIKAVVPGLVYCVAMFVLFAISGAELLRPNPSSSLQQIVILCETVMPALLTLVVGWQRRDYRLGALAGLVIGVATNIGFALGALVATAGAVRYRMDGSWIWYIGGAILLGLLGGICGQVAQVLAARSRKNNR